MFLRMNNLFSELQLERANQLLFLINEGLKEKEKYKPFCVFTINQFDVYVCAKTVEKDKLDLQFNVLDFEGNTPNGFSANWRNYSHIKQELNL